MTEPSQELTILQEGVDVSWLESYQAFVLKVLSAIKISSWELSITFCTDKVIQDLNADFRGKNEPTDVLSFEADSEAFLTGEGAEPQLCGDLVISLETLKTNAAYFQVNEEEELKRLTVHGLLHLSGWDHTTNETTEPMLIRQEEILKALGEEKVF